MLKETHHRIANQLALLVGMIQTQISAIRKGPEILSRESASDMLHEAMAKIVAVAQLNRRLAMQSPDGVVDLADLLIESHKEMISSLALGNRVSVSLKLSAGCLVNAERASILALVLSEIVMNAVKYAHPTGIPVEVSMICMATQDGGVVLEIGDDGVGLPEGFDHARDAGVGFKLIRSLVEKIGATLEIESDDLGLRFRIVLPPAG